MRLLVVIPTYNEVQTVGLLVSEIFDSCSDCCLDILIVDDASPDGTGDFVEDLTKKDSRVHLLRRSGKLGLGTAYVSGFQWGLGLDYDAFIEMDADFSHRPKDLAVLISLLQKEDCVIGSRYIPGGKTLHWGIGRKILSRFGSLYARFILGVPISDFTGGFNGWKREVLEKINLTSLSSGGYSFQIELKYRAFLQGFYLKEFPILFQDRRLGQSKMNLGIILEALVRIWQFRLHSR